MSTSQVDHPITIEPVAGRVRVLFDGAVVADTTRALVMHETIYPPIYYVPREDAAMDMLEPSDHTTRCPFKGNASYFSLRHGEAGAENAVWSYETPLDAVADIRGHLAFFPRHVDFEVDGA